MYTGPLVFTQVMDFMPLKTFQRCVERYQGNFSVKNFTCLDQFPHCQMGSEISSGCESLEKSLESCVDLFQISGTYSENHLYDKRSGGFAPAVAEGDKKPVCFS